jgi:hypothetical protein
MMGCTSGSDSLHGVEGSKGAPSCRPAPHCPPAPHARHMHYVRDKPREPPDCAHRCEFPERVSSHLTQSRPKECDVRRNIKRDRPKSQVPSWTLLASSGDGPNCGFGDSLGFSKGSGHLHLEQAPEVITGQFQAQVLIRTTAFTLAPTEDPAIPIEPLEV